MRILFTCGGTAGHINPALAIAGRLRELVPELEVLFVGAKGNMELELVPREGYEVRAVTVSNLHRSLSPKEWGHNLRSVKNAVTSVPEAKRILRDFRPDAVVGTGGYVCYPVIRAAKLLGIPTAIHESNAVPGLTTKLLMKSADVIMVGFADCKKYYREPERVTATGTPVRGEFLRWSKAEAKRSMGLEGRPLIVSFWGSLGASRMNVQAAAFIAKNIAGERFAHIHAVGNAENGLEGFRALLEQNGVRDERSFGTDVRQYIFDMPRVMAAADIVICRAGASTLSELTVMGKASILVPSPFVTNNHQEKNARVLEERGAAICMPESEATGEALYSAARAALTSGRLAAMEAASKAMGEPEAADKIAAVILGLAGR